MRRQGTYVLLFFAALFFAALIIHHSILYLPIESSSIPKYEISYSTASLGKSQQTNSSQASSAEQQTHPFIPSASSNSSFDGHNAIYPLSFGLPEGRFARAKRFSSLNKSRDFAVIIPGKKGTYIYKTEDKYYDGYADALFGITFKKGGWDCFRHYEIIAAGSMPYFLHLDQKPVDTMADFPFSIVQEAMALPGMPAEEDVILAIRNSTTDGLKVDETIFDRTDYNRLMDQLIANSLEHLTWASKAKYMMSSIQSMYPCMVDPKILFVTSRTCEYMSCVVFGGFYAAYGNAMSSLFGPKHELFTTILAAEGDTTGGVTKKSYGKGMSYSNVFTEIWNSTQKNQDLHRRLDQGYFNMIVFTNGRNKYCNNDDYFRIFGGNKKTLVNYQKKFNPLVVVVDGSDITGCHRFFGAGDMLYHQRFIREHEHAIRKDPSLPARWTGCDASTIVG